MPASPCCCSGTGPRQLRLVRSRADSSTGDLAPPRQGPPPRSRSRSSASGSHRAVRLPTLGEVLVVVWGASFAALAVLTSLIALRHATGSHTETVNAVSGIAFQVGVVAGSALGSLAVAAGHLNSLPLVAASGGVIVAVAVLLGGHAFQPTATAPSVRLQRDGHERRSECRRRWRRSGLSVCCCVSRRRPSLGTGHRGVPHHGLHRPPAARHRQHRHPNDRRGPRQRPQHDRPGIPHPPRPQPPSPMRPTTPAVQRSAPSYTTSPQQPRTPTSPATSWPPPT